MRCGFLEEVTCCILTCWSSRVQVLYPMFKVFKETLSQFHLILFMLIAQIYFRNTTENQFINSTILHYTLFIMNVTILFQIIFLNLSRQFFLVKQKFLKRVHRRLFRLVKVECFGCLARFCWNHKWVLVRLFLLWFRFEQFIEILFDFINLVTKFIFSSKILEDGTIINLI